MAEEAERGTAEWDMVDGYEQKNGGKRWNIQRRNGGIARTWNGRSVNKERRKGQWRNGWNKERRECEQGTVGSINGGRV